jgi:hypothetical protein
MHASGGVDHVGYTDRGNRKVENYASRESASPCYAVMGNTRGFIDGVFEGKKIKELTAT